MSIFVTEATICTKCLRLIYRPTNILVCDNCLEQARIAALVPPPAQIPEQDFDFDFYEEAKLARNFSQGWI